MMQKVKSQSMKNWSDILLLIVSISLIQLHTTRVLAHEKPLNITHEFVNTLLINGTILRKTDRTVGVISTDALNNNDDNNNNVERHVPFQSETTSSTSSIERDSATANNTISDISIQNYLTTSQNPIEISNKLHKIDEAINEKLLLHDKKFDDVLNQYSLDQLITTVPHQIIKSENYENNSNTKSNGQDSNNKKFPMDDNENLFNKTKSTIISLINDTNVNYRGDKVENMDDVIVLNNSTISTADNVTSEYFNIVGNFSKNSTGLVKKVESPSTLATNYKIVKIDESKDKLLQRLKINNHTTDIVNNNEIAVNKSELKSNTNPDDKYNFVSTSGTITSSEINQLMDAKKNKNSNIMQTTELYDQINNSFIIKNTKHEKSLLDNNIGESHVDKKFGITQLPIVVNDNSIQQMNQPKYYKKFENSLTNNLTHSSETPVHFPISPSRNMVNSSLTFGLNIKNDANDIPRNIEVSPVLIEKRSGIDLTDNNLHDIIGKNSTNLKLKNSSPMNYSDIQSDVHNSKLIIPPINITENTTALPQLMNSSLPLPPIFNSSSQSTLNILSSTTFPAELNASTFVPTTDKLETTTFPLLTSSSTISTSVVSTSIIQSDNSTEQTIDIIPTTTSSVDYEFIGPNGTTTLNNKNNTSDDHNFIPSITTTSDVNFLSNSTISSYIPEISNENNYNNNNNSYINDDNVTTNDSNIDEVASTIDDSLLYTTTHETETNFDTYAETTVTDEAITFLSHTSTSTSHPFSTSIIITIDDEVSTVINSISETATSDLPNITSSTTTSSIFPVTTTIVPFFSTSQFNNIEGKTSTMTDDFTTTSNPMDTETINIIQVTTDITRLLPEDVTVLVRIVVETNWSDICSQLSALKQALADVLSTEMNKVVLKNQVIYQRNPCTDDIQMNGGVTSIKSTISTTLHLYIVDQNGNYDLSLTKNLPNLYRKSALKLTNASIRSFHLVEDQDAGNAIAVIVVSCVAFICLVLLASLLFIIRKRQTRFNYGERCRPVSLDAYSLDNVSAYNSVRRKGAARMSKRSYGNPTFEDSSVIPSHPLNFSGLSDFCSEQNAIFEEFTNIPQVTARIDELPNGAEIKNRYANVVPLPETRVPLMRINNDPLTEYINANYVRGPKNAVKYYIGCQAPIDNTVIDFWRMIWEQQSKVIIMLTDLIENGVEKCVEYIPPSEVTDCNRLYGDFQVTLKKRETKEKYAISTLHLKNLENNTYREISHIWYLWPVNGPQTDAAGLIAVLLEARAVQRGGAGPIVIHCSPGTGRTGTLIALDLGIRQYEITRTIDVPRVVYTIRRDRAGAVQTKEQYFFIYKALNLYAAKLAGGNLETT